MPWLRTAALTLNVRGGLQSEPRTARGLSGLVCEMVQRGAANLSSRDIVALQDNLGIDRNSGVSSSMASFSAAMPPNPCKKQLDCTQTSSVIHTYQGINWTMRG